MTVGTKMVGFAEMTLCESEVVAVIESLVDGLEVRSAQLREARREIDRLRVQVSFLGVFIAECLRSFSQFFVF